MPQQNYGTCEAGSLQATCSYCCPTNSIKALMAWQEQPLECDPMLNFTVACVEQFRPWQCLRRIGWTRKPTP